MSNLLDQKSEVTKVQTIDLDVPVPVPMSVDADRTLVVVVDLENEFCTPSGMAYLGKQADAAVVATDALLKGARYAGTRVLWIRSVREPTSVEFRAFGVEPHLLRGSNSVEFTDPLAPYAGEKVIEKWSHDCFNQTGLDEWLREEGITAPEWSVLVTGVGLDVCVNHAVLGFSVRGYRVGVMLDCVAPNTGPAAAATLWRFGHAAYYYNIQVTTSDMLTIAGSSDAARR